MAATIYGSYNRAWRDLFDEVSNRWKLTYGMSYLLLAIGFPAFYLSQGLHVDESLYLVVGEHLAEGSTLYVDVIDHKPPAIFYLAAGASTLFEQPHVALRLLGGLAIGVTGLLVLRLGTRLYDADVGMVASLLYLVGSYLPHFDGFYFMTEQYVALCTVVAASFFLRNDSRLTDAGVGVALGVGVLFNQAVFLFGAAILAYFAVRIAVAGGIRRPVARDSLARTLAIGAGFALPVGLTLALFAAMGTLGALVQYAFVVPITEYHPPFNLAGHVWMTLSYFPVWVLGLGGVLFAVWGVFRDWTANRALFVALWAVFVSYPGMTQFAGDHKLLYVFPPVAILAAATFRWLWSLADLRVSTLTPPFTHGVTRGQVATVAIVMLAASTACAGAFNVVYGSMVLDTTVEDQQEAAAGVAAQTEGDVYTFPFSFDVVYFGEGVTSPDMYVGGIYSPELAERVTGTLEAKQVPYVAVHQNYVADDGDIEGSGYFARSETMVGEYITSNYERVGTSGEYVVYERTDGGTSADRATGEVDAPAALDSTAGVDATADLDAADSRVSAADTGLRHHAAV